MDEQKIGSILKNHEQRISALERKESETSTTRSKKKLSIREFMHEKNPTTSVHKTLAVAYFCEINENMEFFNVKDIENMFRSAKESLPSNINRDVDGNIANGHIMEAKEKKDNLKAWVLTNSGEEFVEGGFKNE